MPAGQDSTCVIVVSAESRTPVGLTHRLKLLLGPTGWNAMPFADPLAAFAELCLHERAQASRAAWGLQRQERTSLVIVDPLKWPGFNDLVAAARCYAPSASVWAYRDGNLQAIASPRQPQARTAEHDMTVLDVDAEEAEWGADVHVLASSAAMPARGLRLAESSEAHAAPLPQQHIDDSTQPATTDARSAAVSREEIDLLLQRGIGGSETARGSGVPA